MYALVAAGVRQVLQIADHVHNFVVSAMNSYMQHCGVVVKALRYKTGRSRIRFPIVSLEFFIDIILPVALWP